MEKIKIGIIGSDSFHTVALVKQYQNMSNVDIVFVDKTIRGNMKMSLDRQPRFESMLEESVTLREVDLSNHEMVDIYLVLNVDSSTHLNTIKELEKYNKPIFVDKPIFTNISDFSKISGKVMSSSGLRFTDFIKEVDVADNILIEGPLFYVDEVESYFWYGIHMVEMLQAITNDVIQIDSVKSYEKYEIVTGKSGTHSFKIKGYYDDTNFKVSVKDKSFELSSYDHLYSSLAKAILATDSWVSLDETKKVIQAILDINALKK